MPVIQKPKETGIPVADYLYSAEPDISPVPLAPAIAREKALKAVLEALPKYKSKIPERHVEILVSAIPQQHLNRVKVIEVVSPEDAYRYYYGVTPPIMDSSRMAMLPRAWVNLRDRNVHLVKGRALPKVFPHEVGHLVEPYIPLSHRGKIALLWDDLITNPAEMKKFERILRIPLFAPEELVAELYANSIVRHALPQGDIMTRALFNELQKDKHYRSLVDLFNPPSSFKIEPSYHFRGFHFRE